MSPCDRATTSYWRSIVTIALLRVVSEIFNVEKCRDLEVGVRGHSRSLKVVPFGRSSMVSFYSSLVTLSLKRIVERYSTCKYTVTLKLGLGSFKVIENDTIKSVIHDFLLTFNSNHRPISHHKRRFPSKIAIFHPCVFNAPAEGVPLGIGYRRKGQKAQMMRLPDGRKRFKIDLVV